MNMFFKSCLVMLPVFAIGCKENAKAVATEVLENAPPNIVLIVADDMGYNDLGCYGNDFIETPHLDRLAKEGIRFTDGYAAAPLCSPSRASLLTGLHPIQVNITEHIHGNPPAGPHQRLKTPPVSQQLDLEFQTTAELLKAQGYRTAHIGKWHLGGGDFLPEKQGFDVNIAGAWNGLPKSFFYPFFPKGEKPEIQDSSEEGDYLTDVLTDKAADFITAQKDSVFFLSLNYYSPHVPIEGKEDLVEKYRKKRGVTKDTVLPNIHYAAMIESIDQNVGRLLELIQQLGLEKNTLVIFTSDNGGLSVEEVPFFAKHTPPTDNGPLRDGKGYVYEGGIREPFLVKWPLTIAPGTSSSPVIAQDLFNTFAEVSNSDTRVAGSVSLLPILKGETPPERGLLWHLPHYSPQHGKPASAYREGDWKIIHHYEDDRYELFNLQEDLGETRDLAISNIEKLEEMKQKLHAELKRLKAKMPVPNPNFVGTD